MGLSKLPEIQCLICGKIESLRIMSQNEMKFILPDGWKMRARDWGEKHPSEYQVVCSDNCLSQI